MSSALVLLLAVTAPSDLIAPGASLQKVAEGYAFTEGPAVDRRGDVYFTDQPNDRILRWSERTNGVEEWMKPAGRANGMAFDRRGNLIACADGGNELWSIAPDKKVTVLVKDFGGKLLNGPNDVWIRPDGGMYFTDPLYARPYWTRDKGMQQSGQHVYFLAKDRKTLTPVATDLKQPNGLVGSPDGKLLYVADIGAGVTYRYRIAKDGALADKTKFCDMGSDGVARDERGNIYLTGRGVTVFDPQGKQIERIEVPEGWTGNVTFGGRDRKTLFVTASKSVYTLKMAVKGGE
ncbi:MAG: SMP-30/gluconolactonase/LRE family protein [Fimbriimonas sp.]